MKLDQQEGPPYEIVRNNLDYSLWNKNWILEPTFTAKGRKRETFYIDMGEIQTGEIIHGEQSQTWMNTNSAEFVF